MERKDNSSAAKKSSYRLIVAASLFRLTGKTTKNVVPFLPFDETSILPPCAVTIP
jgi:hypothetical protein